MRLIYLFFFIWLVIIGTGCETTNVYDCNKLMGIDNFKKIKSYIYGELSLSVDFIEAKENSEYSSIDCRRIHRKSDRFDSGWLEQIIIYYPSSLNVVDISSGGDVIVVYSASGGIKKIKNSCIGIVKSGRVELKNNSVVLIDAFLDFYEGKHRDDFCEEQFGTRLLYKG